MRSIHHRDPQTRISDSHFVLLLPSSLFLPAAPVTDTGGTQPPTPTLDRAGCLLDAAMLYGSAEVCAALRLSSAVTDQLTPAPPIQLIIAVTTSLVLVVL
ncbi:hypothetical protein B0H14DRAFT_3515637 [Mycena olivaceomarginata]|nr:hypothetical protein B0H14DRAFT_3515637 [Mycena olivaceomarginata]